jgi:hypothetical protein
MHNKVAITEVYSFVSMVCYQLLTYLSVTSCFLDYALSMDTPL